ncbi:MAG: aldo/keto reductase [Planctomycetota bacterium]
MPDSEAMMTTGPLGNTGLTTPPMVYGTSCLGNLYQALSWDTKLEIVRQWFEHSPRPVVADSAGKYGAGLALEMMGKALRELGIPSEDVLISNKLGWRRVPLEADEPTFEPGAWAELEHDAVQDISADGIERCLRQGNELLGAGYHPQMVSVHDPDEYLAAASSDDDREQRFEDVVAAYQRLFELKAAGEVKAVGVGAKDWKVIERLAERVDLDWVMFANSMTIYQHPADLLAFIDRLHDKGIGVINSAVFHAGYLVGGQFLDYEQFNATRPDHAAAEKWRTAFWAICEDHSIKPAHACVQFGLMYPRAAGIALNTSAPKRVGQNAMMVSTPLPDAFWQALLDAGLIHAVPAKA